MGLLIDGKWHDQPVDTRKTGGEFKRPDTSFRNWITKDGSAEGGFKAEKGRYHLYVAYACPWAHRTILYRKLKKLEDVISMSTVHPHMADHGWEFKGEEHQDPLYQKEYLYEIYLKALADYTGRVTVPV
ncbi:MAG: glutathione S-transferase family protein, partial [Gammaproteobacteria bacterium]|nr:glutathione S-transferase family protein [Gammaproteobacteria bacterium]